MARPRLAWFILGCTLAGACGGDDETADAAPADASAPDGATDAAVAGPVTLSAFGDGQPVVAAEVVFSDGEGQVVARRVTDQEGRAVADLLPGGSVTLLVHVGDQFTAITWSDVQPGDQLAWGTPDTSSVVGMLEVTLPGAQPGASRYEVRVGCLTMTTSDPSTTVSDAITTKCLGSDQNIDVVALAFAASGALVGYATATDVPVVSGGITPVSFAAWTSDVDPLTVTLHGAPAAATSASLEVHFRIDGLDFGGPTASASFSDGTATLESLYLKGHVADQLQYVAFVVLGPPEAPEGTDVLLVGHAGTPASADHDLSGALLPAITSASAGTTGGRVSIAWTAAGSLASSDCGLFMARWTDGGTTHQWFAMVPPGTASPYRLPALPDELAAYRPTPASAFTTPAVIFIDADYVSSWAAMRTGLGFRLLGDTTFDTLPVTGGTARATIGGQKP